MVGDVGHHGDQGGCLERSVSYTFEEVEPEQGGAKAEGVVYSGKRRRRPGGPIECRTCNITSIARRPENVTGHGDQDGESPYKCQ